MNNVYVHSWNHTCTEKTVSFTYLRWIQLPFFYAVNCTRHCAHSRYCAFRFCSFFLGGTYLCNSKRLLIKIQFLKFMEISHCFTSFYSHSAHSIYVCFPNGLVWPVNFMDLPFFKFFYRKWRRWHFRWGKSQLLRMVQIKWQNKSKRPILI